MPNRILITGGAGFIGSFLADHFAAKGHSIRVLDSLDPQVHPAGPPAYLAAGVELVIGDVRDKRTVLHALDGIDVVVHCAAAVGVAQSLYRVQHYVDTNVGGTAVLLEALAERGAPLRKLLLPTSMTAYGEGVYRRRADGALVRPEIRSGEAVERQGWEPVESGTGVVRAFALAMDHPTLDGVVLNVGTGVARRIGDVGRDLAAAAGRRDLAPEVSGRFRAGDVRHCYADGRRAEVVLGFRPVVDWQTSLGEILEWARSAPVGDHFERADRELEARGLVR